MPDTRIWMYRKAESRLFAHPDEIPAGEGWQHLPVPDEPADPEPASASGNIPTQKERIMAQKPKSNPKPPSRPKPGGGAGKPKGGC